MPRSPRQKKVYHLQKCRTYILKALDRLDKIGVGREAMDDRMKVAMDKLQESLNFAFSAANGLLDIMTSKSPESTE